MPSDIESDMKFMSQTEAKHDTETENTMPKRNRKTPTWYGERLKHL